MNNPIQPTPVPTSNNTGYIIAIIIVILIAVLYYFISPYYQVILDYIETMKSMSELIFAMGKAFNSEETTQKNQSNQSQQTQQTKTPAALTKPSAPTTTPVPDDSASSIQGQSTPGYCYVGEWKGIRSCVKVNKTTPCKTQVYSTEELCVNPTLRP
jgi:hypothetical protein